MKFIISSYKKALFIAFIVLFIIPQSLFAQREKPKNLSMYDQQPYHFGFIVALNQMAYTLDYKKDYQNILYQFKDHPEIADKNPVSVDFIKSIEFDNDNLLFYNRSIASEYKFNFTVGVVGNLRLSKYFDLRLIPTISFGSLCVHYDYDIIKDLDFEKPHHTSIKTEAFVAVVEFPTHIKYKSKRHNNFASYIIAGGNPRIDCSFLYDRDEKKIHHKAFDLAAEIGVGVDFYTYFFKFGIEAKMSFGLIDGLNKKDNGNQYDASINGLHNRMFQLSLTFE